MSEVNYHDDSDNDELDNPFKSALCASLYELERFQSNHNPPDFNAIPKGTELGEMAIVYCGKDIF
jgi:hypothetical protein